MPVKQDLIRMRAKFASLEHSFVLKEKECMPENGLVNVKLREEKWVITHNKETGNCIVTGNIVDSPLPRPPSSTLCSYRI